MSVVTSFPARRVFTHSLSKVASRFLGASSKFLYNIASKLPSLANMANSSASR